MTTQESREMLEQILQRAEDAIEENDGLNAEVTQRLFDVLIAMMTEYGDMIHHNTCRPMIYDTLGYMHQFVVEGGTVIFKD